ncbi:SIR2 family transcriptional regulator (macronuclear) [Tetrahymena thermophila SB210]|uniref:SIR2 family transcriptional regulator n=1 Tax=Tetrahymena thermophila (strain SB210) TaxID=312017 RepID=Q23A44_TETTS|nr:SIR2 family transcriptional regulator [Tetrahymena thermophila SB210]EAR93436.1 SIR2 family transcriptional regulator [Tetrahymena thermophila SB210]|eukprot:XP_001013681.1 SIR2 family transcriptional regulator [Tetrahymena thermophila SB210]
MEQTDNSSKQTQQQEETKDCRNCSYEETMKTIEETRLNCQRTMQICNQSIQTIGESIKTANEAKQNIDGFFDQYNQAMNSLSEKISGSFSGMSRCFLKNENTDKQFEDSRQITVKEGAQFFKDKKKVVFLTGAGISVASGIPTFKGVGAAPLFEKDGVTYQNEQISTYNFMKNKPDIFWERNLIFLGGQLGKKYNVSHLKIQQLVNQYKQIKTSQLGKQNAYQPQAVIVTQNTDGLHCQAFNELNPRETNYMNKDDPQYGFCPDVFEVHGSKTFLRCDNQECKDYDKKFLYPQKYDSYKDFICETCKTQARPNVLYFDESYDEKNYRINTLNELTSDMDLLISIGTQLDTGYAAQTVSNAVQQKIPVIEISLTPVIQKGGLTLKGKAEEVVPQLCDLVMELNKQLLPTQQKVANKSIAQKSQNLLKDQNNKSNSCLQSTNTSKSSISNKVSTNSAQSAVKTLNQNQDNTQTNQKPQVKQVSFRKPNIKVGLNTKVKK